MSEEHQPNPHIHERIGRLIVALSPVPLFVAALHIIYSHSNTLGWQSVLFGVCTGFGYVLISKDLYFQLRVEDVAGVEMTWEILTGIGALFICLAAGVFPAEGITNPSHTQVYSMCFSIGAPLVTMLTFEEYFCRDVNSNGSEAEVTQ